MNNTEDEEFDEEYALPEQFEKVTHVAQQLWAGYSYFRKERNLTKSFQKYFFFLEAISELHQSHYPVLEMFCTCFKKYIQIYHIDISHYYKDFSRFAKIAVIFPVFLFIFWHAS